jgi:hypothetical protein
MEEVSSGKADRLKEYSESCSVRTIDERRKRC